MAKSDIPTPSPSNSWFPATHWTQIVAAQQKGSAQASQALEDLCTAYWYPIYAYIRRKGHSDDDAKDIAQGFFHHILERNLLGAADRTKGKFRSFLLGSLNYYLSNLRDFQNAKKRGGGLAFVSLDDQSPNERYTLEPVDDVSPEKLFDRRWALDLLAQAKTRLRDEFRRLGKEALFDRLQPFLQEETGSGDYPEIAAALNMKPGAVTTAVHRLRHRYAELIDAEIARTVSSAEEVVNERQYIYEVLSRS